MRKFGLGFICLLLAIGAFCLPVEGQLWPGSASRVLTRPTLPATCEPRNGQIVYLQTGNRGIYSCTELNTWTRIDTSGEFNVKAFGALGNGIADDTAEIQAALDAAYAVGGTTYMPYGQYVVSATLNMTGANYRCLRGDGTWNTTIITSVINTPGILLGGNATTRKSRVEGIRLIRAGGLPGAQVPGNYGIQCPDAGTGDGIVIKDVYISAFADDAIRIAGPTGPTVIEDVQIDYCAGYGIEIAAVGVGYPQDITILRGSIQQSWGGIYIQGSANVNATDIELGAAALYPCIYQVGGTGPSTFTNVSASLAAVPALLGVVVISGFGNTIIGGINIAYVATNNLYFQGAATGNTVIGGYYVGSGGVSSGYFASMGGAVRTSFISPFVTNTYEAGKGLVNDDPPGANLTLAAHVTTVSGAANADGVTLPRSVTNYAAQLQPILFGALGAPVNGTLVYCSDCTITSPCAGAGAGALAKRLGGAWICN